MKKNDELKFIKNVQENNCELSMNILWEQYGNRLYLTFLKYLFSKKYNIPLEKEDFFSIIYLSFRKSVEKYNTKDQRFCFLQFAHISTKSDALRYLRKFISKKQNILNNAYLDDQPYGSLFDFKNNITKPLDEVYSKKLDIQFKVSILNNYLNIYSTKNPGTNIIKIIDLKFKEYKTQEISKILGIEIKDINYSLQSFKKTFQTFINNNNLITTI